jgi:hypothetical protein
MDSKEFKRTYELARTNYDETMSHVIATYHHGEAMSRIAAALTLYRYGYKAKDVALNVMHKKLYG